MERDAFECCYMTHNCDFNSHAHVERDAYSFYRSAAWKISTHTLTWSVTNAFVDKTIVLDDFNSHAHVERDHHVELTDGGKYNFNSHAHVERDGGKVSWLSPQ